MQADYSLLIKQLLITPLASAPEQTIVYRDVSRYTYRTLRERIGRLASGLQKLGVGHGDTVAVLDWDSHRYLECFFAVPMMGAVLMTANIRLGIDQLQYTLQHAAPRVLLVHRDFLEMVRAMPDVLAATQRVVVLDDHDDASDAPGYEALLAAGDPGFAFHDFDENTVATQFYTSGTTGMPKGVAFTHRQLVLHTLATCAAFGSSRVQGRLHNGDVYMPMTPMFHVHAWGMPYVATMLGVKQVYPGRYTPDMLLALKDREGVTFSHCVPTILQMLLDRVEANGADAPRLAGWKIVVGGARCSSALAGRALAHGIDAFAGYGMSETCPFITASHIDPSLAEDDDETLSTRILPGRALPLVEIRIVDASMKASPPGSEQQGEVVVRAPWLTQAYLGNAAASEELWRGGYLHTGDIGMLTESGYLQITDRMKDVIKTGGEWISSGTVEDLICQHPAIREAAVIAVPDEKWGERPMAVIVVHSGYEDQIDADALRSHLTLHAEKGRIPKYAIPDAIHFVDALPRTSVGKYDKRTMRERYQPRQEKS